jgi:hypothetical protein
MPQPPRSWPENRSRHLNVIYVVGDIALEEGSWHLCCTAVGAEINVWASDARNV